MEINFRADREAHLKKMCEEMGRSIDDFVNEAILTFMEDYEDGRDAEEVMKRVRSGEEKTYSLEEVMKDYAMDAGDHRDGAEADERAGAGGADEDRKISSRETPHAA